MIKIFSYPAKKTWPLLVQRPATNDDAVMGSVKKILQRVQREGDKAIFGYASELDGVQLKNLQVSEKEIQEAGPRLPRELRTAIRQAKKNIEVFHRSQEEPIKKINPMPGISCWRKQVAIEKVGLYIPGGTAPLFSTVLMLGVPAQIAGCKEIILCTPPSVTGIHPAILYAAKLCGITRLFKAGGAQAIAAMAYGTQTIPRAMKIFGPGNRYVTAAKMLVQQEGIAIDMPAGPSEILVIADKTAVPAFVAADLLSQAEHGTDSQVILVSTSLSLAKAVTKELKEQVQQLPRQAVAEKTLANSKIILVKDMNEAIAFSNQYAPEHLVICCAGAAIVSQQVTAAGSVFLGNYSPEAAGDYASGTNHTLPTNGHAAMHSGISLDSFCKKISYQQLTRKGLENIAATVMTMAAAEGLDAHKNAVAIRLKK